MLHLIFLAFLLIINVISNFPSSVLITLVNIHLLQEEGCVRHPKKAKERQFYKLRFILVSEIIPEDSYTSTNYTSLTMSWYAYLNT